MHIHKSDLNMQINSVENALFWVIANPLLGFLMSCSNKECPRAGELGKMTGLAKQLDVRFMHLDYIRTGHARAYSYFSDVKAPDIGCIHNKPLWEKMVE